MSFLEDLAVKLDSVGVGVYPGTSSTRTIYIGEMPSRRENKRAATQNI